jgi:hypothetical protein
MMSHRYFTHPVSIGMLAFAVLFGIGCSKSSAPTPLTVQQAAAQPQPQPSDNQIATEVQNRLQADFGLQNMPIQTQAVNGVVTLSGTVSEQAARELAANDAAQVNGVRTVVNNLVVQTAQAAAVSAPSNADAKKAEKKADEEARLRRQRLEQARKLREKQSQQQEAQDQQAQDQEAQANLAPVSATGNMQNQAQPAPPPPPPPPPQPVTQTVTIPAGSDIAVRITENLATGQAQPNDSFHGVLANSLVVNGVLAIRRGANVNGVVLDAKDATHFKGRSELSLGLQQIWDRNRWLSVSTDPVVRQGAARGKNTAAKAGGGALLGTLIGALAGGGKGAAIGAVTGAGVGAGANAVTRGEQVEIPSESVLHFTLSQPLSVTVTTTPGSQPSPPPDNSGSPQMQPPN